ncbi:hydantoinase B/oxoprolinase family protein [Caballeronia sp. LZ043]|uniref:hydantoinase B/oxoprolinase family protein n=1 Tax=Caballeronia sp. LZ043 TaxID=3038569 RepID=UPI00285C4E5F|nr:hydantoinase B/oxoprolinase family protein [Caballeronia sp. LZ043]MDR5825868.1 hydantoinase B/oxoprolinase family protein [Caballeronia sp. LZ043]
MKFDKSELQIFANYCVAAAESMAYTLVRTAHSTFVKETEDFSCALASVDGLTFASPRTFGATWYVGLDYGPVIRSFTDYKPGDVCMTNDPYSGYVATHTPDVVMWKPVFYEGEIICFVSGHIHNTDMGGAVPASLSRTLTEIHQEGIRFPPTRVVDGGVVNETLLSWMMANVRAPDQNIGDLKAQIACLTTGERRVLEIVERFGVEAFKAGIGQLLDYSESQARAVARTIPDGKYFFADYVDEDAVGGKPMRIALTLTVDDGLLGFDFSGSDPQLTSSMNVPTGNHPRHALLLVALNYVLYSLNPDILLNAGMLRIATCEMPLGSVLNPVPPAAVGMRTLTCVVVQAAVFGAFAQALPERMPACPASSVCLLNVKTTDTAGRTIMASLGPVMGGAGGASAGDGSDASGANMAFLRNTPVEINEAEVPIRILEYGLVGDSGGAGQYRGGLAIAMEFKVFAPNTLITARNRDRTLFGSWGIKGGMAGRTSVFKRNPGTAREQVLGNTDLVACEPGDVIRLEGNGGGGYGAPTLRAAEAVERDVRRGHVSAQQARELYGVVIANGALDVQATAALRAGMGTERKLDDGFFDYGPNRRAHEAVWTRERYAVLCEYLESVSIGWRFFLKHQMFERLAARGEVATGVEIVHAVFAELVAEFPALGAGEKRAA